MEDISRELEKEIAQSKPKPHKHDRKSRVLIVDDFGEIKSGEHLKFLVRFFFFFTVIAMISTGVLYYLYSGSLEQAESNNARLVSAEKKVSDLTKEKEILMARIVISGNALAITSDPETETSTEVKKIQEKKSLASKTKDLIEVPLDAKTAVASNAPLIATIEKPKIKPELNTIHKTAGNLQSANGSKVVEKTVSIEKFTVTKDGTNGDLLVRFDIRNISKNPGDVSGRIFTILKPENQIESQWLVVPAAPLKNGIPSLVNKGQYFSIAHFKPVKFRIKNQSDPDFYKKATIFIFNNQGDIIFEELIDITEAE